MAARWVCAAISPSNVVVVFDLMQERIRCERIAECGIY
jgi:hypothetical protein